MQEVFKQDFQQNDISCICNYILVPAEIIVSVFNYFLCSMNYIRK